LKPLLENLRHADLTGKYEIRNVFCKRRSDSAALSIHKRPACWYQTYFGSSFNMASSEDFQFVPDFLPSLDCKFIS
jgi:hypothetical protein